MAGDNKNFQPLIFNNMDEKKKKVLNIPKSKIHKLTREDSAAGGRKSAEVKREKRRMRELINMAFSNLVKDENGDEVSRKVLAAINLVKRASEGDLRAIELALKVNGEYENKLDITASKNSLKISLGDDVLKVDEDDDENDESEE